MGNEPIVENDPVFTKSLSLPLLVVSLLLVFSLVWAIYEEIYGLRPWKNYQQRFVKLYTQFLLRTKPRQTSAEKAVRQSEEFRHLEEQLQTAEKAIAPRLSQIDRELNSEITPGLAAITEPFSLARGQITALVYREEIAKSPSTKDSIRREIEEVKRGPFTVDFSSTAGSGRMRKASFSFEELEAEFNRLQARKASLSAERAELVRPTTELRQERDAYLKDHLEGLTEEQVAGLLRKTEKFKVEIKQIHVKEVGLVDRCESCHVGIREPLTLTKADMGGEEAFTSHPNPVLLQVHDPEKFGCTPCHNGNGTAITSVEKAHGRYEHWLWPLYAKKNVEAGCHQCHAADLYLEYADTLNKGKELFRHRVCIGCHRYEGFDVEAEALLNARQMIRRVEVERQETEKGVGETIKKADAAADNTEAQRLYARADELRQDISLMEHHLEELDSQSRSLLREQKMAGPSLKEVKVKLHMEWIPVWLQNPHAFRPTTKMPVFRLDQEQRQAIAAFIWQVGVQGQLDSQKPGDAVRGRELLETRGCLGCHSIGEGAQSKGGTFAANLTRVGEKANYDYLVRWVHNPRQRTRPYCAFEKKDIGPEDYAKKGLPYIFDLDHTQCPNDGHELQVQQMTVMPNLRLTWDDARDVASYLITLKKPEASYANAAFMNDPRLKEQGLRWVRHFGCAGCHEIAGLEEEGRIGTELTREGSKPIERLDFALLTHKARKEGWYDHKGFFEHKLQKPEIYDEGKIKPSLEKLRMPDFGLSSEEVNALSTFLQGSVDSTLPPSYFYDPKDQRQAIREGWWVINKYNCMGCHQLRPGQKSMLSGVPRYQDPDWKEQLPPTLVGEGARVDPNWLARFLSNPPLNTQDINRNGVRSYLKVRMPTFYFSDEEVGKLVRFFGALASQAQPYIPPKLEPLTDKEREMARQLFTSSAAPCLKCHATGDPNHDKNATAPNFLLARERLKPGWTTRWITDPSMIAPGTSMPSGLFRRESGRWVFAGPLPATFSGYEQDQAELLVRYLFQLTPEEQRRLVGRNPAAPMKVARQ